MGLGFLLDRWLKVSPVFTVVGTLAGAAVSFFWVYTKLRADERQYEAEHPHKYDRPE
jgi:F0F1-type ATP synthase assembly protein I